MNRRCLFFVLEIGVAGVRRSKSRYRNFLDNDGRSLNRSAAWFLFREVSRSDLNTLPWPALKTFFRCHGNTWRVREGCAYLKGRMLLSSYGGARAATSPHKLQKAREQVCSLEFSILNPRLLFFFFPSSNTAIEDRAEEPERVSDV